MDEVVIEAFPFIDSLVYKNTDYRELVIDAVRKISESYERRNISVFANYISRDFLRNRTFREEGVRFDFDMFILTGLEA